MKIVHLNAYAFRGGAAIASYRLHTGLLQAGLHSTMLVAHGQEDAVGTTEFVPPLAWRHRLPRVLRRRLIKRRLARYRSSRAPGSTFTDDQSEYGASLLDQLPPADVIHLHWIATFLDYASFFAAVPPRTPLVWTLHDMNPFTGGCHVPGACERYEHQCGACPVLGSGRESDLSRQIWRRKRDAFAGIPADRLRLVALNQWMADRVSRSSLLGRFPVTVIANGLDLDAYAPRDPRAAREVLGLPQDARLLLFVAESLKEPLKGLNLLFEALSSLSEMENLMLITLGKGRVELPLTIPYRHLGHIKGSERLLSLIYSAADVFVLPSLGDNLPNTALEAMACGVPAVGFKSGGVPEIIRDGETGLVVPPGDVPALGTALARLLESAELRAAMSTRSREVARKSYDLKQQAQRYVELYESLCFPNGRNDV